MSARAKDPRKFVPPESTSRDAVREWTDAVGARTADAMHENVMEDAMALRVPGSAVKYLDARDTVGAHRDSLLAIGRFSIFVRCSFMKKYFRT
jgi:hypothetical protein